MGRYVDMPTVGPIPGAIASREDEPEMLKGQPKMMRGQLDQIMKRIEELERKGKGGT